LSVHFGHFWRIDLEKELHRYFKAKYVSAMPLFKVFDWLGQACSQRLIFNPFEFGQATRSRDHEN
jgi:hypothetical protein